MGAGISVIAPANVIDGDGQVERKWKIDGCAQNQGMAVKVGNGNSGGDMEIPRGAIMIWYGTEKTIPQGWVPCDGREVIYVRSDNGEEITRHTVPDMRGRMATALGFTAEESEHKSGDKIGREMVTIPKHKHIFLYAPADNNANVFYAYPDTNNFTYNIAPPTTFGIADETSTDPTSDNNRTYNQTPSSAVLFYIFRAY